MKIEPRSILIVMLSAVGDAVLVLPVANALRRAFPRTSISWALQEGPHSLVAPDANVDNFVVVRRGGRMRNPWSLLRTTRSLGSAALTLRDLARSQSYGRFDLLLALQVYLKAGILTGLTPAAVKLGFDRIRARDMNWVFTNQRIPPSPGGHRHIQDQYLEFLEFLGVDPEPVEYGLTLSREEDAARLEFYGSMDRPAVAVVTASSDSRKNWTPDGYIEVVGSLRRDLGVQPLLVGGNSRLEEEMARSILRKAREDVLDVRGGGLRRLLWLMKGARLVISPDTGPLHMARAVETPVIGLFGFTNPKRSGPYRMFRDLLVDGYARFPGEEYPVSMERRPGGMKRITPAKVLEKAEHALESTRT
jgi:heptosyltransferase I